MRLITLTDHQDHGQGNSPLIIDADRVVILTEFERVSSAGSEFNRSGTKIGLCMGGGHYSVYVQETIYTVAEKVRGPVLPSGSALADE